MGARGREWGQRGGSGDKGGGKWGSDTPCPPPHINKPHPDPYMRRDRGSRSDLPII